MATSQNVDLPHELYALNRRDLGAFLALTDVDVEAVSTVVAMEGNIRGHDGVPRWQASVTDTFPDSTVEVVTVRDLGDLTLAPMRFRGRGASSDTPFEMCSCSSAAATNAPL